MTPTKSQHKNEPVTKKELISILRSELKDRPTVQELKNIVKAELKSELTNFATKDDIKNMATKDDLKKFATKEDLERFVTKKDLKKFATKDDLKQMGFEIIDAMERMMTVKTDKTEHEDLAHRVNVLESKVSLN